MQVLKTFNYRLSDDRDESLSDIKFITMSLKKDVAEGMSYWEVHRADADGAAEGEPLVAFSADCVPGCKNPDTDNIESDRFPPAFTGHLQKEGLEKTLKAYRIISRTKEKGLAEMLGLSQTDLDRIRQGVEKFIDKAENVESLAEMATSVLSKVAKLEQDIHTTHSTKGPIEIEERADGDGRRYFYKKGTDLLHRDNAPAASGPDGAEMWMQLGRLHREDGPAITLPNGDHAYWKDGVIHRVGGAAVECSNGDKAYYIHGLALEESEFNAAMEQGLVPERDGFSVYWTRNGMPHNEKGPAIFSPGAKHWAFEGYMHREDGPASIRIDGAKRFMLHGFEFTEEMFESIIEQRLSVHKSITLGENEEGQTNHVLSFRHPETGEYHREDGPAIYNTNKTREWWQNGKLHSIDGPAVLYEDGNQEFYIYGFEFTEEEYRSIHAQGLDIRLIDDNITFFKAGTEIKHRENGPAVIFRNGDRMWYEDGELHNEHSAAVRLADGTTKWALNGEWHREDGPAIEWADGRKDWFIDGERHRLDGPAVILEDGTNMYYHNDIELSKAEHDECQEESLEVTDNLDGDIFFSKRSSGEYHRLDGPAIARENGTKEWIYNGMWHRVTGPAIERSDGTASYYLADKILTREQHRMVVEQGDKVSIDGMVMRCHSDGSIEWVPDANSPTELSSEGMKELIGELEGKIESLTKEFDQVTEAAEENNKVAESLIENLDDILENYDDLVSDSLETAAKAAKAGVIGTAPDEVINYARTIQGTSDEARDNLKSHIENILAKNDNTDIVDAEFEAEEKGEGLGILQALAGATAVALIGAVAGASNRKQRPQRKEKKEEKIQEEVVQYY